MLVSTTIYFTELIDLDPEKAERGTLTLKPSAERSCALLRELLSLYEGRNRVFPIDRDN